MFDFFKADKNDSGKRRRIPGENLPERNAIPRQPSNQMQIRHPRSFGDIEEVIDRLKENLTVIVYLNELSANTALRVIDILSGAIYALGGGMAELQKDMYIFTPDGVESK